MLPHFPGLVDRLLYLHSPMGRATRASTCLWTHRPTALTLPPVGWAPMPPGIPDPWTGSSAFVSLRGADFHAVAGPMGQLLSLCLLRGGLLCHHMCPHCGHARLRCCLLRAYVIWLGS
jgi:hypothetical protein